MVRTLADPSELLRTDRIASEPTLEDNKPLGGGVVRLAADAGTYRDAEDAMQGKHSPRPEPIASPRLPGDAMHLLALSGILRRLVRLEQLVTEAQQAESTGEHLHSFPTGPSASCNSAALTSRVLHNATAELTHVLQWMAVTQAPANIRTFELGEVR